MLIRLTFTLLILAAWSVGARAAAPVPATQLLQYCSAWRDQPSSSDGSYCAGYVRGFLEGAAAAPRIQVDSEAAAESFIDRARRTRLVDRRKIHDAYCLDGSTTLSSLIDQLLLVGEELTAGDDLKAHDLLRKTLQRFHRC